MPPVLRVVHPLAVVAQVVDRLAKHLARIAVRGLGRRFAQPGLPAGQLFQHLVDVALPAATHPGLVLVPGILSRVGPDRPSRLEHVAQGVNEVENRRELAEVPLVNGPVPRQTIPQEDLRAGFLEAAALRFTRHLPPKRGRVGHAAEHRAHQPLGSPVGLRHQRRRFVVVFGNRDFFLPLGGHRKCGGFRDFRHVGRVAEALRRLRLRIFVKRLPLGSNQASVLGFVPTFAFQMHAGAVVGLAGANAAAVALHDRQIGRTFGRDHQHVAAGGIAAFRQFQANVLSDSLQGLGRNGLPHGVGHHDFGLLEGPRLGHHDDGPRHQQRSQFTGIQPQCFAMREKNPSGRRGSGPSLLERAAARRWR